MLLRFSFNKNFILILIILLQCFKLEAQNIHPKFKHINNEDGLSNSTVESVLQDHRGFMWFGTRNGLNRYDGYEIITYKNIENDSTSLSDDYITYLFEDRHHDLWVGTLNGLNKFDLNTNKFKRYKSKIQSSKTSTLDLISCIYEDRKGKIWVGTAGNGLNFIDEEEHSLFQYTQKKYTNHFGGDVKDFLEDKKGNFWMATDAGLYYLDSKTNRFNTIQNLKKFRLNNIIEGNDGHLWLGTTDNGLLLFNPKNNNIKQYKHQDKNSESLGSDQIRAMILDQHHRLWVGGVNGGLDLFDTNRQTFQHFENEAGNIKSLSQRTVSAIYEDKQGNLWIGTHRGGVNLYSPKSEKFTLYQREPNNNSINYNDVKAFCETTDGSVWIGTDGGGLNLFNKKTKTFTFYKYNPFDNSSLGSNAVLHIMEDKQKDIYVGTWGGGLNLYHTKTKKFTRYKQQTKQVNTISSNYVQKTFEDSRGKIWICTYYGGLNIFNKKTETFKQIVFGAGAKTKIFGNNMIAIEEDSKGNIWIGTDDGGLNCYHPKTDSFTHYFDKEAKKPDLRVIFTDRKHRIWIGQYGLYLYHEKEDKFKIFTNKAGLATAYIKGITEDKDGIFWISTSNGITKINPETLEFKKYNSADGLQGLEFEANAYLKTRDNEMYFGGVNGFNTFYPDEIISNNFAPPIYITGFQIFNKPITPNAKDSPLTKDISITKEIRLSYQQSSISFSFASLNYIASENNHYAYQLSGFRDDWNEVGPVRTASYTNLDPGEYIFKVKASNNDGLWSPTQTMIKIIIEPPYWATWWFRLLIGICLIYATYLSLNFKRKLEIRALEEQKKEEMYQVQMQFFTNISHEFRTPLSLIIGPIEKLMSENVSTNFTQQYKSIQRNANRLMGLINELMDFGKVASGALKLKVTSGNLNLFIEEIGEEFKQIASEKKIKFTIKKEKNIQNVWFDRQILEKIILNLLNNAFKYSSECGSVSLEIHSLISDLKPSFEHALKINSDFKSSNYVYIKVSDNGIGISEESIQHLFERYYRITDAHLGSGVGLAFVKSLTLLHKGNIIVSSKKNKGTEFIIAIPREKTDYLQQEQWMQSTEAGGVSLESISNKIVENFEIISSEAQEYNQKFNLKTILIVDDNQELRTFLKESLMGDYQIIEAENGAVGLEIAKKSSPDLIISDVMMPIMDGINFCKALKADLETSHIPFLMLTAKSSLEAEIDGAISGADFYFSKPVSITLLKLTISNIFEQRKKLIDYFVLDHQTALKNLAHSDQDKKFMDKLVNIIEYQLENPELDVDFLCLEIGMSRTKLYQKIKSITDQSIGEFVRTIKLRKAIEIMTNEDVLLTEVIYRVGIQTQSYFSKAFKKSFGKTPSQYLKEIKRKK